MSYYDPLAPVFQATRLEIERTIMGLEERLLRRKQLDLQIEKDLIQQQTLQRLRYHDAVLNPFERGYSPQIELQKRLRELRTFNPQENANYYAQTQPLQLEYLARLRQIQRQQQTLDQYHKINDHHQTSYSFQQKNHMNEDRIYPLDQSGETLARKYFDGTRAIQYNEQLKKSADKQRQPRRNDSFSKVKFKDQPNFNSTQHNKLSKPSQPDHSTVKKYQPSQTQPRQPSQNNQKTFTLSRQSPIKSIQNFSNFYLNSANASNLNQQNKNINSQTNLKNKQKTQFFSNQNSPQVQSKNIQRSNTKSPQPINQNFKTHQGSYQKNNRSRSGPRSNSKSQKPLSSRQKSSKSLQYHSTKKSILKVFGQQVPIGQKFNVWIKQRSRLAQETKQVYKKNNTKNLSDYFLKLFERQDKLRKELKEKICSVKQR